MAEKTHNPADSLRKAIAMAGWDRFQRRKGAAVGHFFDNFSELREQIQNLSSDDLAKMRVDNNEVALHSAPNRWDIPKIHDYLKNLDAQRFKERR